MPATSGSGAAGVGVARAAAAGGVQEQRDERDRDRQSSDARAPLSGRRGSLRRRRSSSARPVRPPLYANTWYWLSGLFSQPAVPYRAAVDGPGGPGPPVSRARPVMRSSHASRSGLPSMRTGHRLRPSVKPIFAQYATSGPTIGVESSTQWLPPRWWILMLTSATAPAAPVAGSRSRRPKAPARARRRIRRGARVRRRRRLRGCAPGSASAWGSGSGWVAAVVGPGVGAGGSVGVCSDPQAHAARGTTPETRLSRLAGGTRAVTGDGHTGRRRCQEDSAVHLYGSAHAVVASRPGTSRRRRHRPGTGCPRGSRSRPRSRCSGCRCASRSGRPGRCPRA